MRTRKKLSLWAALPPYLGGKRRLCPLIFREIDRILPRRLWPQLTFLDAFLGGGSVSLYAKAQGFRVVACDIAERAMVVGQALIANSRVRLSREDVLRLVSPSDAPPGRIEIGYVPRVFTQAQGRFLDRALEAAAATADPAKAALYRLLAIRMAMLAHPMSQIRPGTIHRMATGEIESITETCVHHYVNGLRLTRPEKLWELAQLHNAGVFEGRGTVHKVSVLDALPTLQADVAYFDPPYPGVMSYEKEYRIVDELLEGSSRPTSPFTAKDGASLIDSLFERATHIPIWLLSLGNAVVSIEELESKMLKHGRRTKAIALRYQHLPAVATEEKKRDNREFLVVGWDENSPLIGDLNTRAGLRDGQFGRKINRPVTSVHGHLEASGTKGTTSETLLRDTNQESSPALSQQATADGRGLPTPIFQPCVDAPDAVLGEPGLDGDGELRVGASVGHGPTVR